MDSVPDLQLPSFRVQTDGNLGAVEICTFVSFVLFGLLLSQGYTYFRRDFSDSVCFRVLVFCVLLLESFHTFTAAHNIYYDTITTYGSAKANSYPLSANVAVETLITAFVQCFFCYRIYRLSKNLLITVACLAITLLRFIAAIALSVESFLDVPNVPNGTIFVSRFRWLITSGLAIGAVADLMIAVSMAYYLKRLSSPMNMKSTTEVINRLIRWSLQTGFITSVTAVVVIICFQAMSNMIWFGVYIILAKLYSNSLLASLNARPRKAKKEDMGSASTGMRFVTVPAPNPVSMQLSQTTQETDSSHEHRGHSVQVV